MINTNRVRGIPVWDENWKREAMTHSMFHGPTSSKKTAVGSSIAVTEPEVKDIHHGYGTEVS